MSIASQEPGALSPARLTPLIRRCGRYLRVWSFAKAVAVASCFSTSRQCDLHLGIVTRRPISRSFQQTSRKAILPNSRHIVMLPARNSTPRCLEEYNQSFRKLALVLSSPEVAARSRQVRQPPQLSISEPATFSTHALLAP